MKETFLRCPVCHEPLEIGDAFCRCGRSHSFDRAKQGYFNLLLANQGHGLEQGDKKELVEARTRFLEAGYYAPLREAIIQMLSDFAPKDGVFCDLACGEGYYTEEIAKRFPSLSCVGVDISKPAVAMTARRAKSHGTPNLLCVVGNMAYLPFLDDSFDALLNCFAPIYEKEFLRVTKPGGIYIRVLPGPEHLLGLKEALYEDVRLNEPKEERIEGFSLIEKRRVDFEITLEPPYIMDLFSMTPYSYKTGAEAAEHLASLKRLETKVSFLLTVYRKQ